MQHLIPCQGTELTYITVTFPVIGLLNAASVADGVGTLQLIRGQKCMHWET